MQINFSVKIEKRHLVFLVVFVCVMFVVGVGAYENPTTKVGHDANETGPGTFGGAVGSLYVFPGFVQANELKVNAINLSGDRRTDWPAGISPLPASNISAGIFGANAGNGDFGFSGDLSILGGDVNINSQIVGYVYQFSKTNTVSSFDSSGFCSCDSAGYLRDCWGQTITASASSPASCIDRWRAGSTPSGTPKYQDIYRNMPVYSGSNLNVAGNITLGGVSRNSWPDFSNLDCQWYDNPMKVDNNIVFDLYTGDANSQTPPRFKFTCPSERPLLSGINVDGVWSAVWYGTTGWALFKQIYCCKIVP